MDDDGRWVTGEGTSGRKEQDKEWTQEQKHEPESRFLTFERAQVEYLAEHWAACHQRNEELARFEGFENHVEFFRAVTRERLAELKAVE